MEIQQPTNWIADEEIDDHPEMKHASAYIRNFFEHTWGEEQFDYLRDSWDKHINDEDPYGRRYAKTALWALVRLRFPDVEKEFMKRMET